MLFVIGAISLHRALETLNPEKTLKKFNTFTVPEHSLNYYSKNPEKVVQNLVAEELQDKTELISWHDVLKNSFSAHASNNNRPLSNIEVLQELNFCTDRLQALVYCQRDRNPDSFNLLKQHEILTMSIVKNVISLKKKTKFDLLRQCEAVHRSPDLEFETLSVVVRYQSDLNIIISKTRPIRLSKQAWKEAQNTSSPVKAA